MLMAKLYFSRIRFLRGANIYHPQKKLVKAIIEEGGISSKSTKKLPRLISWLQEEFPELGNRSHGGTLLFKKLEEGIPLYELLPHFAIFLQNCVGWQEHVDLVKYFAEEEEGLPVILFEYLNEAVGEEALFLARDFILDIIEGKTPPLERWIDQLEDIYFRYALGPSTRAIVNAAEDRGIPVTRLDNEANLAQLGYGKYRRLIWAATTDQTSDIGGDLSQDKWFTKRLLDSIGVPVPRAYHVKSSKEAVQKFDRINDPAVVKPRGGSKGRGITTDISKKKEVVKAYERAEKLSRDVIIEELVEGEDHRFLVVGGDVVAVARRYPAHVVGDAEHTIRELIQKENQNPLRGEDHELPLTKIKINEQTKRALKEQDYTLDEVPNQDEIVWVKETANLSTGGVAEDVTGETHPELKMMASRIAKFLNMDICGVDAIVSDVSKPLNESGFKVIEVNAAPGLRMHVYPKEERESIGDSIVSMMFPPSTEYRIPIIAVTGTNGKTTIARVLSHIFRLAGEDVGTTTTDGIYINGVKIVKGDCTGPWSTQVILRDPSVSTAVFEVARGGMCREGLSFQEVDVGVISNVSEDHLGQYGVETKEDIAKVKGLVYDVVRPDGYGVVNADDPLVREQAKRIRGKIAMVSLSGKENEVFKEHIEKGGVGVAPEEVEDGEEKIVVFANNQRIPVVDYRDCPLTFDGLADFNIENLLFATIVAYLNDVPIPIIKEALLSFAPIPSMNPGRTNLMRIEDSSWCLIDYAHNPKAIEFVGDFLKRYGKRRKVKDNVAVFSLPGDRPNSLIKKDVQAIAESFDRFIVKEDENKRGRDPGELATLIKQYLVEEGINKEQIHLILDEEAAIRYAVKHKKPNSIIWISCDNIERVIKLIKELRRKTFSKE